MSIKVNIIEDQYGFMLHHVVAQEISDADLSVPIAVAAKARFPQIRRVSMEKGYHTPNNQRELRKLVDMVV